MAQKKKASAKKPKKAPAKRPQQSPTPKRSKTSDRIELFVAEYLVDLNGRQAAIRAGYSPDSARFTASELLARKDVQEKVAAAKAERLQRAQLTADEVLERIRDIAEADPNELIELRRICCRYCYGKGHRYQRTPAELERERKEFEAKIDAAESDALKAAELKDEFDEEGGIGWDPRREPNENCPECFGEGQIKPYPKDSRDLSPAARRLYAGVKETQHGLEIKMRDQDGMLRLLADHTGLIKRKVELTGKDGGPVKTQSIGSILEEIDGSDTGLPARHAEASD